MLINFKIFFFKVTNDCVISGDYRGFIMIWDKHIIQAEVIKHKEKKLSLNSNSHNSQINFVLFVSRWFCALVK